MKSLRAFTATLHDLQGISNHWQFDCLLNSLLSCLQRNVRTPHHLTFMRRILWWPMGFHRKEPVMWNVVQCDPGPQDYKKINKYVCDLPGSNKFKLQIPKQYFVSCMHNFYYMSQHVLPVQWHTHIMSLSRDIKRWTHFIHNSESAKVESFPFYINFIEVWWHKSMAWCKTVGTSLLTHFYSVALNHQYMRQWTWVLSFKEICGCPIFKWVAMTWLIDRAPG